MKKWLFILLPALTLVLLFPRLLRLSAMASKVLLKFSLLVTAIRPWVRTKYDSAGVLPQAFTILLSAWYALELIMDVRKPADIDSPLNRLLASQ